MIEDIELKVKRMGRTNALKFNDGKTTYSLNMTPFEVNVLTAVFLNAKDKRPLKLDEDSFKMLSEYERENSKEMINFYNRYCRDGVIPDNDVNSLYCDILVQHFTSIGK